MVQSHDLSYREEDVVRRVWITDRRELYVFTRVTDRTEEDRQKAYYLIITPADTPPIISGPNGNEVVPVVSDLTDLENTVLKELNLFEPSWAASIFNGVWRAFNRDKGIKRNKGSKEIRYQLGHSKRPGGVF